jgi:hypothetical protein
VYIQEFERKLSQEQLRLRFENERGVETFEIGRQLFDHGISAEDFVPEQGIELSERPPVNKDYTPFINYWDVDVAIRKDVTGSYSVIVSSSEKGAQSTYAKVSGTSIKLLDTDKLMPAEDIEAAEEQVVDILQAFARCFGVSDD